MEEMAARKALGEFLRSRRERLTPKDVGLATYGQRRTSGLRREEVAQLAHIGTSWYTSLEQGRSVNPSDDVLNNIAKALQLSADEHSYLHLLARSSQQEQVDNKPSIEGLRRIVKALEPNPAFVLGRCWDLLFWNKAAEFVFQFPPFSDLRQDRLNYLRFFLEDSKLVSDIPDLESKRQIMVARFRADYGHFPNDPGFKKLIEEFMQSSRLFRETWPRHDVQVVTDCHKRWHDPQIGEMEFEHVTLQPPTHKDLKIMIYSASPDTAARLGNLVGIQED